MKWEKVTIRNFLSIEQAEVHLSNRGLVLIEGKNQTNEAFRSNGSGKSSTINAIVYAIYDTTSNGVKADGVVNRNVKKNTAVILEGSIGDDKYRIERYRKHGVHKNKVRLFLNDKEITEKSTKDTNARIESIVGVDYKTFTNSIFFSQGNGAGAFANASDKEKKEILENLVNLDIYGKAQEIAKDKVKQKQEEINDNIRSGERLSWELANIDMMEQQDIESYNHTKNLIKETEKSVQTNTTKLNNFVAANFSQKDKALKQVEILKEKIDTLQGNDISTDVEKLAVQREELNNIKKEIEDLNIAKSKLVSDYKNIQLQDACPVCGNDMDEEHKAVESEKLKEEIKGVLLKVKTLENLLPEKEQTYKAQYDEVVRLRRIEHVGKEQYNKFREGIAMREQIIHDFDNTVQGIKNDIQGNMGMLEKLRTLPEPKPRTKDREDTQGKIKAQKETLLELEKEKSKLEDVVKIYSNSGVKSHVLDLITPFLNERANKYLAILTGSDIEITFSTQTRNKSGDVSDKFDVQVANNSGGETYQSNSEGEKKRIDLAISLALQDLVLERSHSSTNIIFYDEVFDALDSVGSENVITLLKERLDIVDSIFVITHSDHLKNLFEKVITVTKNKNGMSTITEGELKS